MNIFVDVEDTLLLNPNGVLDDGPCNQPNEALIGALINLTLGVAPMHIIIWSTEGQAFAQEAAFKTLPKFGINHFFVADEKSAAYVAPGDIVVDDTLFRSWAMWYTPQEFIRNWGTQN